MDREVDRFQETLTRLSLTGYRAGKFSALYEIAIAASADTYDGGRFCFVELGTWRGYGAIALAMGANPGIPIYTVDDYQPKQGWAGEPYGPEDEAIFERNIATAGVTVALIKGDVVQIGEQWDLEPIGLLFWDLGRLSSLADSFIAWSPHLAPRGIFAIHDTRDKRLGSEDVKLQALASGQWEIGPIFRHCPEILILVKRG